MLWHTSFESVQQQWQAAITEGQESGQAPRFELGQSHRALDHLWTVHTLQTWLATRTDVTAPAVAFGGESSLWLYLFFAARGAADAPQVRAPVLIFTGVERTMQMAAPGALLASLTGQNAPALEPAQHAGWEALPFVMQPVRRRQPFSHAPMGAATWTAWAILLFALALLLSPLFGG
ncbi:MAG: hypothetical protein R2911_00795 [Caldilineaceae bacterium]